MNDPSPRKNRRKDQHIVCKVAYRYLLAVSKYALEFLHARFAYCYSRIVINLRLVSTYVSFKADARESANRCRHADKREKSFARLFDNLNS